MVTDFRPSITAMKAIENTIKKSIKPLQYIEIYILYSFSSEEGKEGSKYIICLYVVLVVYFSFLFFIRGVSRKCEVNEVNS